LGHFFTSGSLNCWIRSKRWWHAWHSYSYIGTDTPPGGTRRRIIRPN